MTADALFFKTDFNCSSGMLPAFILRCLLAKIAFCVLLTYLYHVARESKLIYFSYL